MELNLEQYRERAEQFMTLLDREYYQHFSGRKKDFAVESIYDSYEDLFQRQAIDQLRAAGASGSDQRRLRSLTKFAVDGFLGQATKSEEELIAKKQATLELDVAGVKIPFRQAAIVLSNESDGERRQAVQDAQLELTERELNPIYESMLTTAHALVRDLGWPSYREMYSELNGIDFVALEEETRAFSEATDARYSSILEPAFSRQLGHGLDQARRSDIPYFMRGAEFDRYFPSERLLSSFKQTLAGLGIDLDSQKNITLDLEQRPNKTPRAFCAPAVVPDEIYLVVPQIGGRDDYFALFHEGGHCEHYAHVPSTLEFEFRYLGDNSVTEAFAYLFHHLIEDPNWLSSKLGVDTPEELSDYSRAVKLIYLRRYAAKLRYELELHSAGSDLTAMRKLYSTLLSEAVQVEWPDTSFLADVDPGYYAAGYLRAWALESQLRVLLKERFGELWFDSREAGDFLKSIWAYGQRLNADELLEEVTGSGLDFTVMLKEFE